MSRGRWAAAIGATVAIAGLALWLGAGRAADAPKLRFTSGSHAHIPMLVLNHHVTFRGTVNGADSVWITLDTGASHGLFDVDVAQRLGLKAVGQHDAHGAGGTEHGAIFANVTVAMPGLTITYDRLNALALAPLAQRGGKPLDVIVGRELFEHAVVVIDYAAGTLDVYAADAPAPAPGAEIVPLTFEENLPYIEARLTLPGRAPLTGRFVIDTGSSLAIALAPDVAAKDSVIAAFPRTMVISGRGVGGEVRTTAGRGEAFEIGKVRLEAPIVVCSSEGGHITANGALGNIGGTVLRRFRMTFDYPGHRVIFERGPSFAEPFEADMSGASFELRGTAVRVSRVQPDTPAARADLRVDDEVLAVDGTPIGAVGLSSLRGELQQDGREVNFEIRRDGKTRTITFKLQRLI